MLLIGGTIPSDVGSVFTGHLRYEQGAIHIGDHRIPVGRGTAALAAAAAKTCRRMGIEPPHAILAGDIGRKSSGVLIYDAIRDFLEKNPVRVLTLHYLMPNILYHKRLMSSIQSRDERPVMIADAGSMYVAKAAGQAVLYDLFTPDLGELAFLADEKADHPAYTRGFICHLEGEAPALIARAYEHGNAARYLCVKGSTDYICREGSIAGRVDEPSVEVLEAIGGTGDTLTGIVSALIYHGMDIGQACLHAARANRWAGKLAEPTPATQIEAIIDRIPEALDRIDIPRSSLAG